MSQAIFKKLPVRTFDDKMGRATPLNFAIDKIEEDQIGKGVLVEAHRHDYYHILFVKQGKGEHIIDFKKYKIQANTIFFVSPGQVHSLEIHNDVEAYVVSFDSHFYALNSNLQKLLDYPFFHSLNNAPYIHLPELDCSIQDVVIDIYQEYNTKEKGQENMLRALLEVLLVRASRMYAKPIENLAQNHLVFQLRKLEALIDTHFREYKLVNDYANMTLVSAKHLNSISKKGLNKTVTTLIHERTILEAKRLLLFTDNTVAEIAYELGYTDKSYFMRFFKKQTSYTADSFRKRYLT